MRPLPHPVFIRIPYLTYQFISRYLTDLITLVSLITKEEICGDRAEPNDIDDFFHLTIEKDECGGLD